MRRSLAPSQRNKSLGSSISKFKSPLLKNTGKTTVSALKKSTSTTANNIIKLKEKILEQQEIDDNEVDVSKENQGIEENIKETVTPPPTKKIKLNNYKRPLFTKQIPQITNNNEKTDNQEEDIEEKSGRKLYFNVVWRKKTTKKK